jgi:lipoprotein-anchoring transpeptidase ErfK/SrfK
MKSQFEIHLLLPAEHLPSEGATPSSFSGAESESEIIAWLVRQLPSPAAAFEISPQGTAASLTALDLRHARLVWQKDEADAPWIDPSGAAVQVDLSGTFDAEPAHPPRYAGEEFSAEDSLRDLLARLRGILEPALCGFRGCPLPLLQWVPGDQPGTGHAVFHGVWLADPQSLAELKRWDAEADLGMILEEADVEGRGLREVITAALMMGIVLGSGSSATAGGTQSGAEPQRSGLIASLRSLFGRGESAPAATAPAKAKSSAKAAAATPAKKSADTSKTAAAKSKPAGQSAAKIDKERLATACDENVKVVVEIGKQRAYLLVDGQIALDTPISSAAPGRWTPRGTFTITERIRTGKMSTLYHCPLPFWMRLGESAVGMHIGDLPGYPASHGCIRLPKEIAPILFEHTFKGTQVQVVDVWTPTPLPGAAEMIAQK